MVDYTSLIEQAANEGPDYNEAVTTGGVREPIPAGPCRLRLVGYVEIGEHMDGKKGEEKRKNLARLTFEVSGPKHPPREHEGNKYPHLISITLPVSRNEKSNYYKLFKRMNWQGKAKIMAQLLGEEFRGTVVHRVSGEGDNKRTYCNLRDDAGYTIQSPFVEDPESGEMRRVHADPQLSSTQVFLWDAPHDHPDFKAMWDGLFIDGRYDDKVDENGKGIKEGASKNWLQNLIKSALNFEGSSIHTLLTGGDSLNLPEPTKPERTEAAKEASAEAKVPTPANEGDDPLAAVAA